MEQRVIKFRAWDKFAKMMRDDGTHPNGTPHMKYDVGVMASDAVHEWASGLDGLEVRSNSESFILMQFTGLKDKNCKEIYESDIRHGLYYCDGAPVNVTDVMKWDNERACFYWENLEGGEMPDFVEWKIVGNIFEGRS